MIRLKGVQTHQYGYFTVKATCRGWTIFEDALDEIFCFGNIEVMVAIQKKEVE